MLKLYQKHLPEIDFQAIIAIDHSPRGPALGGCRLAKYNSIEAAQLEVTQLTESMTLKTATHDLPFTGGKIVLMEPAQIKQRDIYFQALGQFIAELKGNFIVGMDSGVSEDDMDQIAKVTPYVTNSKKLGGEPSPATALGVAIGIDAMLDYFSMRAKDCHILIQGVGSVGYEILKLLAPKVKKISIADISVAAIERCRKEFNVEIVNVDDVYKTACDVFVPCGMGGILNEVTAKLFSCKIIAGAANNQLATPEVSYLLHERNIYHAPDYVINGGGVIYCASQYLKESDTWVEQKIKNIYPLLQNILKQTDLQKLPPEIIARQFFAEKMSLSNKAHKN